MKTNLRASVTGVDADQPANACSLNWIYNVRQLVTVVFKNLLTKIADGNDSMDTQTNLYVYTIVIIHVMPRLTNKPTIYP